MDQRRFNQIIINYIGSKIVKNKKKNIKKQFYNYYIKNKKTFFDYEDRTPTHSYPIANYFIIKNDYYKYIYENLIYYKMLIKTYNSLNSLNINMIEYNNIIFANSKKTLFIYNKNLNKFIIKIFLNFNMIAKWANIITDDKYIQNHGFMNTKCLYLNKTNLVYILTEFDKRSNKKKINIRRKDAVENYNVISNTYSKNYDNYNIYQIKYKLINNKIYILKKKYLYHTYGKIILIDNQIIFKLLYFI